MPTLDERQRRPAHAAALRAREQASADRDAISADYGHRSRHETLLAEIVPVIDGIEHTLKHLRGWMRPQTPRGRLAQLLRLRATASSRSRWAWWA